MALKIEKTFKMNGITWQSGHVYHFRYSAWQHDPEPTIILLYRIVGIHPNTGHQWRLIQGINFSYIPRTIRKQFGAHWIEHFADNDGNVELTWQQVKNKYPGLKAGIRRYMFKPAYYIQSPEEVEPQYLEDAIIDTWSKDFSKKIQIDLMKKYQSVKSELKKHNKEPFKTYLSTVFKPKKSTRKIKAKRSNSKTVKKK